MRRRNERGLFLPQTDEERFWSKVQKTDGCWVWKGATNGHRYGRVHRRDDHNRTVMAHRMSWELHVGPIPDGLLVLHRCDNPPCVNPSHLFLGTVLDNNADKHRKQRDARGEKHGMAKLKDSDIPAIIAERRLGIPLQATVRRYGVTRQRIWQICRHSKAPLVSGPTDSREV